jgi:hypothetical protein
VIPELFAVVHKMLLLHAGNFHPQDHQTGRSEINGTGHYIESVADTCLAGI